MVRTSLPGGTGAKAGQRVGSGGVGGAALGQEGDEDGSEAGGRREQREGGRSVHRAERGEDAGGRSQREALFPVPGHSASVLLSAFVKSFVVVPPEKNSISFCEGPKGSAWVHEHVCQARAHCDFG